MKKAAAPQTVDEYLGGVPEPAHTTLEKVRAVILKSAPPETTEVISYGVPMYKYKGMLVGFAAFQNHCSLFPGPSALVQFAEELSKYPTSKGTIRFPVDKPLPAAVLKKIVKARVAENEMKKQP
jgi:uncharacterized protein YdhG (YjbR/CyaY superfamily)